MFVSWWKLYWMPASRQNGSVIATGSLSGRAAPIGLFFWPLHEYMNEPSLDIRLRFEIYEIRLGIHHVHSTNFPNPIAFWVEGIENKSNSDFTKLGES
ncbi:hypothetical protein AVEN_6417-1 [Araneus ventricosus]|uniref:Uncharacterized protein n=1 Tax=Araneus ventricosus TaxID=182803 RepID=A0A4Y2T2S0_ARAVE|nr:hypothetical protein AVEN_6417-1 [Araneus ventricosus]